MRALGTQAALQAGGDCYLWPSSEMHLPPCVLEVYLGSVTTRQQPLTRLTPLPFTACPQRAIPLRPRWWAP
jgi:hypothetical protein